MRRNCTEIVRDVTWPRPRESEAGVPLCDPLEPRLLLAGEGVVLYGATLLVTGTHAPDAVEVALEPGGQRLAVTLNGSEYTFDASRVRQIVGRLGNGDNTWFTDPAIRCPMFLSFGSGDDTVTTGAGSDYVHAGGGDNVIDVRCGNNRVVTGNGNDTIATGNGTDVVYAGSGINNVNAGGGINTVVTGNGNDTITASGTRNVVHAGHGNNTVTITGAGISTVVTGNGDDTVTTDRGTSVVYLAGGNDTFRGGDGPDIVYGGPGDDKLYGGGGDDKLYGQSGSDTIVGGPGQDLIIGGSGVNYIAARLFPTDRFGRNWDRVFWSHSDVLIEDLTDPGPVPPMPPLPSGWSWSGGHLTVDMATAADVRFFVLSPNALRVHWGAASWDFAGLTSFTFYGTEGPDYVNLSLLGIPITGYGRGGDDVLKGGSANDIFVGGDGNDTVFGNAGADSFRFVDGIAGNDYAPDFNPSEGDTMERDSIPPDPVQVIDSWNDQTGVATIQGTTVSLAEVTYPGVDGIFYDLYINGVRRPNTRRANGLVGIRVVGVCQIEEPLRLKLLANNWLEIVTIPGGSTGSGDINRG